MTWQDTAVAPSGTHHLRGGVPLYVERFDEVLKFHPPGLAPVRRGEHAWHIRVDGSPAYSRRFLRTFGFYEGFAAVVSPDGWHHIRTDGTDLYRARYAWCGNFQGGRCPVREPDGAYLHISSEGEPAYGARWRYAGDYRDGIAVVQAVDGRSSHIDLSGELVHGVWFLDLDVFHKGFARARDGDGWTHVDGRGRPVYGRRFASVEPFYNGQARVERFDGGLEVIDVTGRQIAELRPGLRSEFASLSGDLVGFWRTQAICAAVELGVFDALPGTIEGVAQACGLEPERCGRLLRALAELHLTRQEGSAWWTTERGDYLKATHPWTLAGAAVEYGRRFARKWEALPAALRSDAGWRAPDIFGEVAADRERMATHHRMLMSYALHDYASVPSA
ncbi:MAG: methyltransferase, partial [Deltaproteobacteria bacterium]